MCGPFAIPLAAAAMAAVTTVVGGVQASNAAKGAAAVSDMNADAARAEGVSEASRARLRLNRFTAMQNAAYAKSGVTQSGSALDVLADTATEGELDIANVLYGANSRARAYRFQGRIERFQGSQALSGAVLKASTSFLGSAFGSIPMGGAAMAGSGNAGVGTAFATTASRNAAYGGYWG